MFIKKSFANEIAAQMESIFNSNLVAEATEKELKLIKAAEYLNSASEIFEDLGLTIQAEVATKLMESASADDVESLKDIVKELEENSNDFEDEWDADLPRESLELNEEV